MTETRFSSIMQCNDAGITVSSVEKAARACARSGPPVPVCIRDVEACGRGPAQLLYLFVHIHFCNISVHTAPPGGVQGTGGGMVSEGQERFGTGGQTWGGWREEGGGP